MKVSPKRRPEYLGATGTLTTSRSIRRAGRQFWRMDEFFAPLIIEGGENRGKSFQSASVWVEQRLLP